MDRRALIDNTVSKIKKLPDKKIKEVNDFTDFLLSKIDEQLIQEGILTIMTDSDSFDFLEEDEDIYSIDDLKERYK